MTGSLPPSMGTCVRARKAGHIELLLRAAETLFDPLGYPTERRQSLVVTC